MKSFRQTATFRCMTVILSAALVVAAWSMSGCSFRSLLPSFETPEEQNPTVIPDKSDTNSPPEGGGNGGEGEAEDPPALPMYYDPLTGLGSDVDLSALCPVAICLGNGDGVGYGLSAAKILVEAPIEGGGTRFLAITNTYASLSMIGGIRATRPYLQSLSSLFSAVSVHAGQNESGSFAVPLYPSIDYTDSGMGTVFYRNPSFAAPSNLFTSGTRLVGAMESFEKQAATLPFRLVPYGEIAFPVGEGAKSIILPFSGSQVTQFTYDEATGLYLRRQNSKPHTDGASGEQLAFTNLLLLVCESSIYNKASGTEFSLNVTDGGSGYYISNGKSTRISWSRKADSSFLFLDESGAEILCNRGRTYIGLVDIVDAPSIMIVD